MGKLIYTGMTNTDHVKFLGIHNIFLSELQEFYARE